MGTEATADPTNPELLARLAEGKRSIEAGEGIEAGDLSQWLLPDDDDA